MRLASLFMVALGLGGIFVDEWGMVSAFFCLAILFRLEAMEG